MPCDPVDVYECELCECQFEPGVADSGPGGSPRCPQCGLQMAHRVAPEDVGDFVVTAGTRFR